MKKDKLSANLLSNHCKYTSSTITELNKISESLESSGKEIIRLNRGDPVRYFPTPKYIIDAYTKALKEGKTYYSNPAGLQELRKTIANKYTKITKGNLSSENILITAGVSEALLMLNNTLINSGDTAILPTPHFTTYSNLLKLHGGHSIIINYNENKNWRLDLDMLKEKIKKTRRPIKYLIFSNPNNPTGAILNKKELKMLVEIANANDILLVSDETYDEIVYNGAKFNSLAEVAKGVPHIILNGSSKVLSCTGFRVGYAIFPEQDKKSMLIKQKMCDFAALRFSVNTPAQYAVLEALRNVKEHKKYMATMINTIQEQSNYAANLINSTEHMCVIKPNSTFHLLPRISFKNTIFKNDVQFAEELLKQKHVKVSRGSAFGANSHIRITTLPNKEILKNGISKIDEFIRENKKS
ncbi:Aspartate aminotransferase [uncultured archaeon]|nr:Aspartate aminotransferase [uncultured archaeon]